MGLNQRDQEGYEPLIDLMESDRNLQVAFESMQRTLQSVDAIDMLSKMSTEHFQSAVGPVMSALAAGTSVDVSDMVYSQESMAPSTLGILKKIGHAIAEFFRAFMDYMANLDIVSIWLSRKVSLLAKAVPTTTGMHASQTHITMGRNARYLRVGAKYIQEAARLEADLKYLQLCVKEIGGKYYHALINAATDLPGAVHGKKGALLETRMVELVENLPLDALAQELDMQAAPRDRFNRENVRASKPLLGGHSIFYLRAPLSSKGVSGFIFHGFLYETTLGQDPKQNAHVDFAVLEPGHIGEIPTALKGILDTLTSVSNLPARSAIKRAESSLNNLINNMEGTEADIEVVRKTVNALTYWMGNPSRALYSNAMSVVRAALTYCEDSIKTYK